MSSYESNEQKNKISLVKKSIIKSLLYPTHDLMATCFGRLYTCGINATAWLYSGVEGALCIVLDIKQKTCKFIIFNVSTFESMFECEIYKRFSDAYTKGSEKFYYFEIQKGFIGFEFMTLEDAELFNQVITNITENFINKRIKETKVLTEEEKKKKGEKMISALKAKFQKECTEGNYPVSSSLEINQGEFDRLLNCIKVDPDNKSITLYGSCNGEE